MSSLKTKSVINEEEEEIQKLASKFDAAGMRDPTDPEGCWWKAQRGKDKSRVPQFLSSHKYDNLNIICQTTICYMKD